ncbi:MAG: DNA polymerase III subunit alpha, partial [Thermoleophilaceae bacterium]|nr:DNA polymerase III subunit alpha [Thermoleophilaceae bacterium]
MIDPPIKAPAITEPIAPDAGLNRPSKRRPPLQGPTLDTSKVGPWSSAYVELHAHSAFSFHDGVSLPHEFAIAAVELGYGAFALTDHDSVAGAMEFAHAAAPLGLAAILGSELTLADGHHITLLAENANGWANLCQLITVAHADTRPQGQAFRTEGLALGTVLEHAEGLICLSGCAARGAVGGRVDRGDHGGGERVARLLLDAFGPDHLRIELQRPFARHDRARNNALAQLARDIGVPTVATGNVHAHNQARAPLQDVFVALANHATLDETEPRRRGNFSHTLASPQAMCQRFAEHPQAVRETLNIAERVQFDLTRDLRYRYPHAGDPAATTRLAQLCRTRITDRYGPNVAPALRGSVGRPRVTLRAASERLEHELAVIDKLGLSGFFLIHHDLLELAREIALEVRGASAARAVLPPGRGRGSSVASIVCYLTGLSHVDPIEAELCLGRFLNEDIESLPDIDLDFPRDIRKVLIPRIHERYGHQRSALVAAFPTYRTRGSLRGLGKALGLPVGEIERIIRTTDRSFGETIDQRVRVALQQTSTGRRCLQSPRWQALLQLLPEIHRLPRHISQHSGGMVIATDSLVELCPVQPAAMVGRQFVQWDKDSCGDAGFVKIDLLGLGMLSAVERCVDSVYEARGQQVDLSRIALDDEAVFEDIRAGDTTGVFQIESRAQMQMLVRSRPENIADLIVQVAIVRPGPIIGGAVNPYLERRKLLRADPNYKVPYEHPLLEAPLKETLGAIVFQDQVLEVAQAMAGFTVGEAEGLRRAMSRKRSQAALEHYHQRFREGAAERGVTPEVAEQVFAKILGFSGFGFPKAHSAAFGLLAYQTSWLRHHYPPEFVCSLLNEQPMGFYPPDALIHEAQRRNIPVLPPDINKSDSLCTVEWTPFNPAARESRGGIEGVPAVNGGEVSMPTASGEPTEIPNESSLAIRVGLGYVKGVRSEGVESLVRSREVGGVYESAADLAARSGADGV